jgi:hypothetical protein
MPLPCPSTWVQSAGTLPQKLVRNSSRLTCIRRSGSSGWLPGAAREYHMPTTLMHCCCCCCARPINWGLSPGSATKHTLKPLSMFIIYCCNQLHCPVLLPSSGLPFSAALLAACGHELLAPPLLKPPGHLALLGPRDGAVWLLHATGQPLALPLSAAHAGVCICARMFVCLGQGVGNGSVCFRSSTGRTPCRDNRR